MLVVFVAGIGLSLAGFLGARQKEEQQIRADFSHAVGSATAAIERALDNRLHDLTAIQLALAHLDPINQRTFSRLVQSLGEPDGGTQPTAWAPLAPDPPGKGPAGESTTETPRRSGPPFPSFPIALVVPPSEAASAVGRDLAAEPAVRDAMAAAMATGALTATPGIMLPSGESPRTGVLLLVPVYNEKLIADPNQSLGDTIRGFLVAELQPSRLLEQALWTVSPCGLSLTLDDVSAPPGRQRLCRHGPHPAENPAVDGTPSPDHELLLAESWYTVGGRRWRVTAYPTASFLAQRRTWHPWLLLGGGTIVSLLLAAYWATRTRRVAAIAQLHELERGAQTVRTILDSVQAGIVVVDPDTKRLVDVNRAAEVMLGGTKDQLVGLHCFDLICSKEEAIKAGSGHCQILDGVECSLRRADGAVVPILKTVVPVTLAGRQYLLETFVDITTYRETEEARHAGEQKLHAISDCAIDALVMIDPEGRVMHWNPAAERMFGYSVDEILGRDVHAVLASEADFAAYRKNFPAFSRTGRGPAIGHVLELEAVHKDGSLLPIEVSISSIQLDRRWWAVGVIRDLTERKEAERQLRRHARALEMANQALEISCREAQAANHAKGEFLANMSHELRTPLHGILSFASFGLKKGRDVPIESLLEYFQLIYNSGQSLLALVNNLLDLAKLESGKIHLDLEEVDLGALIVGTTDEFRSQVSERKITIECRLPDEKAIVFVDRARMQQVVRNLLSNAIKFSSDGGHIEVCVVRRPGRVTLAVRDHGVGIPPAELGSVFDKFVQSSKTRTSAGGTGLGLAICREIITAHRGTICAANAPDGGAVLSLTIPEDLRVEEPIGSTYPDAGQPTPADAECPNQEPESIELNVV